MSIDWSKAPKLSTGAMVANFSGGSVKIGDVEFIGAPGQDGRDIYHESPDAWTFHARPELASAWNGEGLPPVGTVCEFVGLDSSDWHRELRNGAEVRVIAHFDGPTSKLAAFTFECDGGVQVEQGIEVCFRPLRTAEQIAAEEREAACRQLCIDAGSTEQTYRQMETAYRLYDAGYRKQVQP
jgi:hypothetical protein